LTAILSPEVASALISDGVHHSGNPQFYFLPPLVAAPDLPGSFDPTLDPVVEIVELTTETLVARFTTDSDLRIDDGGSAYIVTWHTRDFELESGHIYRIVVSVDGLWLGFADVAAADNSKDAKNVDALEFVPLVIGHNLPIKFAIQQ
jgi:hypothetical protein